MLCLDFLDFERIMGLGGQGAVLRPHPPVMPSGWLRSKRIRYAALPGLNLFGELFRGLL